MAGNPRKFSEKIAIQQRKLNEEQNAFESIIAEVTRITKPVGQMTMYANQWPGPSGGNNGGVAAEHAKPSAMHVRERSPGASGGHGHHSHIYHPYRPISPHSIMPRGVSPSRQVSPDTGQQNSFKMPQQYGNQHMYLVPPQDTSWRRTHSDPGIHASVMHPSMPGVQPLSHSPAPSPSGNTSQGVGSFGEMPGNIQNTCYLDPKANMGAVHVRPRSCENVPHLPNINIQPSNEPDAGTQISISNSTGSLPDLPSSLLPAQMQQQQQQHHKIDGGATNTTNTNPSVATSGAAAVSAPGSNALQQRHSIQLPVQYPQGVVVGNAQQQQKYIYGSVHRNVQPSYGGPESPRSASGSPNEGIPMGQHLVDSSASSPQPGQSHSPGSPYCSLQAQMQNINILDIHNQSAAFGGQQQQGYYGIGDGTGSCYSSLPSSNSSDQRYIMIDASTQQIPVTSQEQMYHAMLLQDHQQQQQQNQHQQQHHHQQHPHHQQQHQQHQQQQYQQQQQQTHSSHSYQPSSPQGGQIPNIIFTGTDGSVHHGGSRSINGDGLFVDAAVELLSSDLRMSLDPVDLESLHGLGSEQALHIDAASEDQLRRDRV